MNKIKFLLLIGSLALAGFYDFDLVSTTNANVNTEIDKFPVLIEFVEGKTFLYISHENKKLNREDLDLLIQTFYSYAELEFGLIEEED